MEPTTALDLRPTGSHAPAVGRDVHARLAGTRPNQDVDLPPFWGEDGFTFDDLVDLVNPLHHIPLVGSLYRSLTDDQIAAGPRIMGGALFAGGPVGAMAAAAGNAVNASVAHETGNDIGGHVLAWLGIGDDGDAVPAGAERPVAVAEATDLPWLNPGPVAHLAPETARQVTEMSTEVPATNGAHNVAAIEPRPNRPTVAPATAAESHLSDAQWGMLVASVDPQHAAHAAGSPTGPEPAPMQPADIAAAMVRALDKYEALTRARTQDSFVE